MRIPQETVDAIYAGTYLPDLIGEYTTLKPRGRKNGDKVFVGVSPFNSERTPSTFVYCRPDGRYAWKDFSSGNGGIGPASFLMKMGYTYRQALEHMAERIGIEIPSEPDEVNTTDPDYVLRRYLRRAQEILLANPVAMQYLAARGIGIDEIVAYEIGLGFESRHHHSMIAAGLTSESGFQYFPGRIVWPIFDLRYRRVGLTGRGIEGVPHLLKGKWVNSPSTAAHVKARAVSGLKEWLSPGKDGSFTLVEGSVDTIPLHSWGHAAGSVGGTAISPDLIRHLSRRADKLFIGFDRDKAGIRATPGAFKTILAAGMDAGYWKMPNGHDMGDYLPNSKLQGLRPELWPWPRFFQDLYERDYNGHTQDFRRKVIQTVGDILAVMPQDTRIPAMDWMRQNWVPIEPGKMAPDIPTRPHQPAPYQGKAEYAILVAYLAGSSEERDTIDSIVDFEFPDKALWEVMSYALEKGEAPDCEIGISAEADALLIEKVDMPGVQRNAAFLRQGIKRSLIEQARKQNMDPNFMSHLEKL